MTGSPSVPCRWPQPRVQEDPHVDRQEAEPSWPRGGGRAEGGGGAARACTPCDTQPVFQALCLRHPQAYGPVSLNAPVLSPRATLPGLRLESWWPASPRLPSWWPLRATPHPVPQQADTCQLQINVLRCVPPHTPHWSLRFHLRVPLPPSPFGSLPRRNVSGTTRAPAEGIGGGTQLRAQWVEESTGC